MNVLKNYWPIIYSMYQEFLVLHETRYKVSKHKSIDKIDLIALDNLTS